MVNKMITEEEKFKNAVCAISHGLTTADQYPYDQGKLQLLADELRDKRFKDDKRKMVEFEKVKKDRKKTS